MAEKQRRGNGESKPEDTPQSFQPSPPLSTDTTASLSTEEPPPASAQSAAGRLYTQCPLCKTVYRIVVAQLRQGNGEAYCQHCQAGFNALITLAETAERAAIIRSPSNAIPHLGILEAVDKSLRRPSESPAFEPPAEHRATPGQLLWGVGAALLLTLLALQMGWFVGPDIIQNERMRPWLETACANLGCRLPVFRAPRRIQIINHDLRPAPDGIEGYEFALVLSNQASLPQAFPSIRLSLETYNGNLIAASEFQPADYLAKSSPALMPVGTLTEIHLILSKPTREIGGFSFELF